MGIVPFYQPTYSGIYERKIEPAYCSKFQIKKVFLIMDNAPGTKPLERQCIPFPSKFTFLHSILDMQFLPFFSLRKSVFDFSVSMAYYPFFISMVVVHPWVIIIF